MLTLWSMWYIVGGYWTTEFIMSGKVCSSTFHFKFEFWSMHPTKFCFFLYRMYFKIIRLLIALKIIWINKFTIYFQKISKQIRASFVQVSLPNSGLGLGLKHHSRSQVGKNIIPSTFQFKILTSINSYDSLIVEKYSKFLMVSPLNIRFFTYNLTYLCYLARISFHQE